MNTLVRWDPSGELDSLQSEMNRLLDGFFGSGQRGRTLGTRRWVPPMDLVETDEHLVLRADLPGMRKEDVSIEIRDGVLTISGERRAEHEEKTDGVVRVERGFGTFSRSLTLPEGIDAGRVSADFSDGVLEVRIPKPTERQPHRVEIGSGDALNGTATEK